MSKQIISNYTFNATSKTVTLTDFATVRLDRLQLITDVTTNTILYNFADSTVSTASVSTNVITLSTVGSATSTDKLQIIYDVLAGDPVYDSGQSLVKVTNGTNTADVVANDTGYNGMPSNNAMKVIPFTTSATGVQTLLANTDVRGYAWISIYLTSAGTGLAWTGQWSPSSGGTYASTNVWQNWSSTASAIGALGTALTTYYEMAIRAPFFQLVISAMTGGSTTGFIILSGQSHAYQTMGVQTTPATTNGYNGDSLASSTSSQTVFALNGIQGGGTTVDRQRSVTAVSDGGSATGITAAGMVGFNGTSWERYRTNATGAVIAAGATTAQTSTTQTTYNANKLAVVINISAYTSGSLTFTINGITSSGFTYPILASTALTATGTTVLRIFPGSTPSANAVSNDMVPRSFNVVVSGTFVATYGVDFNLGV